MNFCMLRYFVYKLSPNQIWLTKLKMYMNAVYKSRETALVKTSGRAQVFSKKIINRNLNFLFRKP